MTCNACGRGPAVEGASMGTLPLCAACADDGRRTVADLQRGAAQATANGDAPRAARMTQSARERAARGF